MGLLDNMRARLGPARNKVSDLAQRHGGSIEHGLDRAARMVDERTKGKYSEKIHAGTDKAKGAMDRLAQQGEPGPHAGPAARTGQATAPGGAPETGGTGRADTTDRTTRTPQQDTPPGPPPPMS
ncbi:antitoxin [Streptomyces sp. NPDC015220]|uniref:antitoxin n=1 Tax=Streptomyces sp. NPDC015220 TaxID=3364947 RepID=UPI0036FE2AFD